MYCSVQISQPQASSLYHIVVLILSYNILHTSIEIRRVTQVFHKFRQFTLILISFQMRCEHVMGSAPPKRDNNMSYLQGGNLREPKNHLRADRW
jgi:hypothetical protein